MSMPRLSSTGLAPAVIARMPCWTTAWASTVAVVVPSPTMSLVLMAASLTSWAPMFSNWSRRWISRAMVTPSLVTTGEPVIFSRMTLRPLGPSVDFTASASWSTPASSRLRASSPKRSSLAIDQSPPGQWLNGLDGRLRHGRGRLGDEDRAAADAPRVEIGDRIRRGVERVGPGVQGDLPGLGQDHELGEVAVGPHDVPDDVALGRDDVQRRDRQRSAVADDEVRAGRAGHVPAVVLGALLGNEVEHDVGASPAGQVLYGGHLPAVGDHGVVGAQLLGQLESVRVLVHHDDPGGGQRGKALDADVTEAARADDHAGGARVEQRDRLAHRVVRGDPRVGQRRDVLGLGRRVELDAGPRGGEQVLGHPAVTGQARERAVGAVHVVAGPAGTAQAARNPRMQDG